MMKFYKEKIEPILDIMMRIFVGVLIISLGLVFAMMPFGNMQSLTGIFVMFLVGLLLVTFGLGIIFPKLVKIIFPKLAKSRRKDNRGDYLLPMISDFLDQHIWPVLGILLMWGGGAIMVWFWLIEPIWGQIFEWAQTGETPPRDLFWLGTEFLNCEWCADRNYANPDWVGLEQVINFVMDIHYLIIGGLLFFLILWLDEVTET